MAVIPLKPFLRACAKHGYANGAFNVNSVAQAKAVIEIHEVFRSGAILQGADLANGFMGGRMDFMNSTLEDKKIGARRIADTVRRLAEGVDIPVVLHLDHGKEFEAVRAAIDSGYSSVMIDGSHLAYDENVEITREVVKYAHPLGVSVEGELGVLAGVEDDVFSESSTYTNPTKVVDFFKRTGIDCLALSYGTKHGASKGKGVKLRKEIVIASMENLRHEGIEGMLVSHGSSTVPEYIVDEINALGGRIRDTHGIELSQLKEVISYGIAKINIDTDIRLAVTRNVWEYFSKHPKNRKQSSIGPIWQIMEEKPEAFDPRVYLPPIKETLYTGEIPDEYVADIVRCIELGVKEAVGPLIIQFGSLGSATLIEPTTLEQMADEYRKNGGYPD
jgi:fructose-bisphosphate aldolase class II